ncbi:MAG: NAD(P)/FAD-dependent oxidoreductase [Candidatus Saganbacteria bacterium]|nr:NAD(P)/FAD-dependent oxidoreductase [Candidatus Saganbacteria bacterium]
MDRAEIVVIGAGVVGLAIAAELGKKHRDVVLLEKETSFGQGTSSRNSEVIHAGIYYSRGSLKAKLCVEGNKLLYKYCQEHKIPHKKLGKIIVALNEGEVRQLDELLKQGEGNWVRDLRFMMGAELAKFELGVKGVKALYSPNTGIVDSHRLMKTLEQEAEGKGATVAYGSEVRGMRYESGEYIINVNGEESLASKIVINSAGLFSDQIAAMAGIDLDKVKYRLHFCKGEYFAYTRPAFIKHLVYPVPERDAAGLGVHSVLDLAGGLKFGPNVEYVKELDYRVDPAHRRAFWEDIVRLFPQVREGDLAPDQAGVRPKLQGPGEEARDFVISEEARLGLPGLINLIGIESPGLTACLAIGEYVKNLVK